MATIIAAGGEDSDSSEVYGEGKSEKIIGDLVKETDAETRKKLYIATKCAYRLNTRLSGRSGRDEI